MDHRSETLDALGATRRQFLLQSVRAVQLGLTAATVNALLPGWALARGGRKGERTGATLVVIYLRGGCDALNVVIPFRDPTYYALRPGIGIAPKDEGAERGVVPLDKLWGLHPALEPLYPLWERKLFAPLVNTGSPHPSRSHFDCMDFMEYAAPGDRTVRAGWLNRYLDETRFEETPETFRAVALQGLLPRSLRGAYPVLAVPEVREGGARDPLDAFDPVYEGGAMMGEGEGEAMGGGGPGAGAGPGPGTPPAGSPPPGAPPAPGAPGAPAAPGAALDDPVLLAGRNTIDKIRRFREITSRPASGEGRYPANPFGQRLRELARVIKSGSGLEVAAIDYPGWDHHAREGGFDGTMARMLGALAEGLRAFADDLGERMQKTLVLTMSEFGRTCRENGNLGTDHGHGGVMLALGGPVAGGKVYGSWTGLADKALYEERDLPVTTDFRAVFGESLESLFGFEPPKEFFPGYRLQKRERLKFLKPL